MKKLMVAVAAAVIGIAADAATYTWSAQPEFCVVSMDAQGTEMNGFAVYFFNGDSYSADYLTGQLKDGKTDVLGNALGNSPQSISDAFFTLSGTDFVAGDTPGVSVAKGIAVILDAALPGDAEHFYIAQKDVTLQDMEVQQGVINFSFGQMVTGTPDTWQSIPEPTSGLLLLLGVAGLALRRRRA